MKKEIESDKNFETLSLEEQLEFLFQELRSIQLNLLTATGVGAFFSFVAGIAEQVERNRDVYVISLPAYLGAVLFFANGLMTLRQIHLLKEKLKGKKNEKP